ncbi:MAG TPA: diguanylate cyclase [Candidatus Sulfotelmatobacter sp.]|jgi:diguanylate cyclase (GGDEF)-like protein/PAS domain S-box-containing protein|nr:diguanylate cyclase [Candidatus Sulfotelmatobacter sp.]
MSAVKWLLGVLGWDKDPGTDVHALSAAALESFPAPTLIAAASGQVDAINAEAEFIADIARNGALPGLTACVARAVATGHSQVEVVMVPGPAGSLLYELNVLPLADGTALVLAKDVTLESNLRAALVESRQRYKDLVEISSDFAWEVGPDGTFVFVSPRGALGHSADQLVGRSPEQLIMEQPGVNGMLPFRSDKPVEDAEVWFRRADGAPACILASSSPLLDGEGRRRGARGVCRDITLERERDAALARANNRERLLTYIVRTIRDVVDPADMLKIAAEATARALGSTGCQIYRYQNDTLGYVSAAIFGEIGDGSSVLANFVTDDRFEGGIEHRQALAAVTRYRHDINGAICVWRDGEAASWNDDERLLLEDVANQIGIANEQIANHERILTLSRTDGLTGLFNRRAFFEELTRRFGRLARDGKAASLIYVDLDNFKLVNDVHGHKRGDEALQKVREILIQHTRPIDLLARLGGDEFAIWLEGGDEEIAVRRCRQIIEAGGALNEFSGSQTMPLTMSLGLAVHTPGLPETLNELLARADEAMYAVKRDGKCDFRIAGPPHAKDPLHKDPLS